MSKPVLSPAISQVVAMLDRMPVVSRAHVFGSLLDNPQQAGDVDIAFVVEKPYPQATVDPFRRVLRAGAMGTPRYGLLDVFVCFPNQVWVRNDECLGFTRAKSAQSLRQAIGQGVSWNLWRQGVVLDEGTLIPATNEPGASRSLKP